ncbi:MAG: hypothetical protein U9Q70_06090 [Chloroflexota bacterium]|nr:hypothetical protein [Chloroflexota bacterium]
MNEQHSQAQDDPTSTAPETEETTGHRLQELLNTTGGLLAALGRATATKAEELSSLMLVRIDTETRTRIDQLITAGVVENRRQGAEFLLTAGVQAKEQLFKQVAATEDKIHALHQQLRSLVTA